MGKEPIVHATSRRENAAVSEPTPTAKPQTKPHTDFVPEIGLVCEELPSKSLAYPPNVKIKYRGFIVGEVKKISESKNMSTRDRMDILLEGISVEGMDKYDLTLNDLMYIALLRKISTLGDRPLSAQYTCGKCYHKGVHNFELSALEFKDMVAPALPVTCDLTNLQNVSFSPLTVRQLLELVEDGKDDDDLAIVAKSCISHPYDQIYKLIYNSGLDDTEILNEVDEAMEHGVKPVEFTCSGKLGDKPCTSKLTLEVDGQDTLFMPFRKSEKPTASRIRFGR